MPYDSCLCAFERLWVCSRWAFCWALSPFSTLKTRVLLCTRTTCITKSIIDQPHKHFTVKSLSTGFLTRLTAEFKGTTGTFHELVEWRFQTKSSACISRLNVLTWYYDRDAVKIWLESVVLHLFFKKQFNYTSMVCWRSRRCMCAVEGKLRQTPKYFRAFKDIDTDSIFYCCLCSGHWNCAVLYDEFLCLFFV